MYHKSLDLSVGILPKAATILWGMSFFNGKEKTSHKTYKRAWEAEVFFFFLRGPPQENVFVKLPHAVSSSLVSPREMRRKVTSPRKYKGMLQFCQKFSSAGPLKMFRKNIVLHCYTLYLKILKSLESVKILKSLESVMQLPYMPIFPVHMNLWVCLKKKSHFLCNVGLKN